MEKIDYLNLEVLTTSDLESIEGGFGALATAFGIYVGMIALADYAGTVAGDRWNS